MPSTAKPQATLPASYFRSKYELGPNSPPALFPVQLNLYFIQERVGKEEPFMVEPPKRGSSDFGISDTGKSKEKSRIRKSLKLTGEQEAKESLLKEKAVHVGASSDADKITTAQEARALLTKPSEERLKLIIADLEISAVLGFGDRNPANATVALDELALRHPTLLDGVRETGVKAIAAAKKNYKIEYARGSLALFNALKASNPAFKSCLTLEEAMNRHDLIAQIESLTLRNPDEEGRIYARGTGRPMVLPQEIGKFTALKRLEIRGCNVTELPASLGECSALEDLIVANNKLTRLPASLGKCTFLRELNANFNELTRLPHELGSCKNLNKLFISYNHLEGLPEDLQQCQQLTDIFLAKNSFPEGYIDKLSLLFPKVKIESK